MGKYLVWLGISFESWGVEKVNWMLLESLIDEVEVDGKSLCMLWPLTYEKKSEEKLVEYFNISSKTVINYTNVTAMNRKGLKG